MRASYRQYCPLARASEFFAERWTPVIIRNLLAGCHTFTELTSGAPGIPKTLLSQRLALLERYKIIERRPNPQGRGYLYHLSERGQQLQAVCDALGHWGARWLELSPEHVEPGYVLWATCRLVDVKKLPPTRVVARVDLRDQPKMKFWLLLQRSQPELCTSYPGGSEDLVITTDSESLVKWNLRQISFGEAVRTGLIVIDGSKQLARAFPSWIRPSRYAQVR